MATTTIQELLIKRQELNKTIKEEYIKEKCNEIYKDFNNSDIYNQIHILINNLK